MTGVIAYRYITPPWSAMLPRMYTTRDVCLEKATSTYASNSNCPKQKPVISSDPLPLTKPKSCADQAP